MFGFPVAADFLDASAFGGAVATRCADRRAVKLHELRIVHIGTERAFDGFDLIIPEQPSTALPPPSEQSQIDVRAT